ncbi:exodeoxyribonuclease III [Propionibacteriaceae bacterium Y1700]|uniref:exodeoxyribonuclease III n=1 Tax=Microlunatus sp. Y1700 TaxID=3418487 RepID=UPI003DA7060D
MRIASLNVNGIRAAVRRGLLDWLDDRQPDIVGLQEMRSPADQVPELPGYHVSHHLGEIPGRNGVAVLSRTAPTAIRLGTGSREFDREGRYVEVDLELGADRPGLTVGSLYLPKGGTPYDDEVSLLKYERKLRFCRHFRSYLTRARRDAQRAGREFLVMGDWNIAPTELDLRNWRTNKKSEGFLPEERDWMASIQSPRTLVDVVRMLHPDTDGPYSWWSWRGQSFTNDAGWRIDHQLATPALAATAIAGGTDREPSYEARKSDHSPVVVDYDL